MSQLINATHFSQPQARYLSKMITMLGSLTVLGLIATQSQAAGLEYSRQSIAPLLETGNYLELSYAYVDPHIEGEDITGSDIDDMMDSVDLPSAALKVVPTPNTALALVYDKPFGVDTIYQAGSIFTNTMGTTEARISTDGLTFLGGGRIASEVDNSVWIYGGVEYQTIEGTVTAADITGTNYEIEFEDESTLVPVVGVAYDRPAIALRAALTYRGPAEYNLKSDEKVFAGGTQILAQTGQVKVELPQSVNLDFQTGLSEKYQLLGMVNVRWVNWSEFDVNPPLSAALTQEPLAVYDKDAYSVEVALGKQFTPKFSGEVRVGYDSGTGEPISLLGPYDAFQTFGLGGEYQITENLDIAAGGQYIWFEGGNIETKLDGKIATIDDGDGFAFGMKLGYHF